MQIVDEIIHEIRRFRVADLPASAGHLHLASAMQQKKLHILVEHFRYVEIIF